MNANQKNIMDFGATGDGITDDSAAFQKALDGTGEIIIPKGKYRITKTLLIGSDTKITSDKDAVIFACGEIERKRGDFLLTNRNQEKGNRGISINGGIWDGNNQGRLNKKGNIFDKNGCSGATLNFRKVDGLNITGVTLANSVAYNLRMCEIKDFHFEDIEISSEVLNPNQDGFHFGGFCKNGVVKNIKCSNGSTNDDLIALNADDCVERVENLDMVNGPIENIIFEDIQAENCHTFVRILSVISPIRGIKIRNVQCGCRIYFINMDGARYCATPIFKEDDFPNGSGIVENIEIAAVTAWATESNVDDIPLMCFETLMDNFHISNFKRNLKKDCAPGRPVLKIKNVADLSIKIDSDENLLSKKDDNFVFIGKFTELTSVSL